MAAIYPYFHSYFLCLFKPKLMLDWLRHGITPFSDYQLPYPEVGVQIGISWSFAIIQGIARLLMANLVLQLFLHYQNTSDFFYALIDVKDALFPYYFLLFSTALDLVFFPILALINTEIWNFILRFYARWLGVEGNRDEIVRDITSVALSSHFFLIIPIIGVVFQQLAWMVLLFIGCRHQLGASRTLAFLILMTPNVVILMGVSLLALVIFCLFTL
jgi:hypothetical protein